MLAEIGAGRGGDQPPGPEHKFKIPHSADGLLDGMFSAMGIAPEAIEEYLSSHKKGARIAANTVSFSRVVLGEITIRSYERARKAKNVKMMSASVVALGFIFATDFIDGYIARKAGIDESKMGKFIDSATDVYLRLRVAKSSIMENPDALDKIRGVGELLVGSSAIPDMFRKQYDSTLEGKAKMWADGMTALTKITGQILEVNQGENPNSSTQDAVKMLENAARVVGTGLAWTDGVKRRARKMKARSHLRAA